MNEHRNTWIWEDTQVKAVMTSNADEGNIQYKESIMTENKTLHANNESLRNKMFTIGNKLNT